MDVHLVILFLHVLAGAFWLGGSLFAESTVAGARRRAGDTYVEAWLRGSETAGRVFPAATVLVLLTAVWMIVDRWEFGMTWIEVALGIFVVSFVVGIAYYGPQVRKIGAMAAERGVTDASVVGSVRRVHMIQRIEMIGLLVILLMMIWKPGA